MSVFSALKPFLARFRWSSSIPIHYQLKRLLAPTLSRSLTLGVLVSIGLLWLFCTFFYQLVFLPLLQPIDQDPTIANVANELSQNLFQMTALFSVVMMGLGWFMNRKVLKAIHRMSEATAEIVSDKTKKITDFPYGELGLLSHRINELSEKLVIQTGILEAQKAQHDAILNSVGEGLVATDEGGNIILMNSVAQNILNLHYPTVIGKALLEGAQAIAPNSANDSGNQISIEKVIAAKEPKSVIFYYTRKDDSKFPAAVTLTPILANGKVIGAVEVFRDVTKEKEIDRMKTEFVSLVSHQLRTPLSAMKWFGEMLLAGDAGPLNPEQIEMVQNIAQSNERMIALVSSLLNISRIESGKLIISLQPTQLAEVVQSIIEELKPRFATKAQTIELQIPDNLPMISSDPKLLRHVYMNFLTNANKYTPAEGIITVTLELTATEIISKVTDTGFGIPQAEQHRLFERFFRASNTAKYETDGTGLGLYFAKSVVESCGGTIGFESQEGKGTTFWFRLPLKNTLTENRIGLDS